MIRNKATQVVAILMSLSMISSSIDFGVLAKEDVSNGTIISVKELPTDIANQKLPVGAKEGDVNLPTDLTVTVQKEEMVEKQVPVTEENAEKPEEVLKDETVQEQQPQEPEVGVTEGENDEIDGLTDEQTPIDDATNTDQPSETNEAAEPQQETTEQEVEETAPAEDAPAEASPAESEPAESEPVESEPAESEPAESEPVESGPTESEPESNDTEDSGDSGDDTSFMDFLFPAIVANAEEVVEDEEQPEETQEATVEYETVQELETVTNEVTLSDIEWSIDAEKSSGATFDSSIQGTKYVYIPTIPSGYGISTTLPTITVVIDGEALRQAIVQTIVVDGVRITLEADEGVFPEGVTLTARKVEAAEAKQVEEAVDEVRPDEKNIVSSYTFDIKVIDADGNEIQPDTSKGKVKVSFELEAVANKNLDTEVYHTDHEMNAEKLDSQTVDETTVQAETDGFSYYTVEFTYNNLQYVMVGDSEIPLADILTYVGLTGTVSNAYGSNDELFSAEEKNGQWIVIAHKAFQTDEWLKVTIDEVEYEIKVTDDTELNWTPFDDVSNAQWAFDSATGTIYIAPIDTEQPASVPNRDTQRKGRTTVVKDSWWKSYEDSIENVVVMEGITSLGDYTFRRTDASATNGNNGLIEIKTVQFPSTLTSIGKYSFAGTGIEDIVFFPNLGQIGTSCFKNCTSLRTATIKSNLSETGSNGFDGAGSNEGFIVTFDEGVTEVSNYLFKENTFVTEVNFASTIETIGQEAFDGCSKLNSITGGENIKIIDNSAFSGCSTLKEISLPNLENINAWGLQSCHALEKIYFPNLKVVDGSAFSGDRSLNDVVLAQSPDMLISKSSNISLLDAAINHTNDNMGYEATIVPYREGTGHYSSQLYKAEVTKNGQPFYNRNMYYLWEDDSSTSMSSYKTEDTLSRNYGLYLTGGKYGAGSQSATQLKCTVWWINDTGHIEKIVSNTITGLIPAKDSEGAELRETLAGLNLILFKGEQSNNILTLLGRAGVVEPRSSTNAYYYVYMPDTVSSNDTSIVSISGQGTSAQINAVSAGETEVTFEVYTEGNFHHGTQGSAESPIAGNIIVYVLDASITNISYNSISLKLDGVPSVGVTCSIDGQSYTLTQDGTVTFTGLMPETTYTILIETPGGGQALITDGILSNSSEQLFNTTTLEAPDVEVPTITGPSALTGWTYGDTVAAGNRTLSVSASVTDGGVLSYQWYRNTSTGSTAISGATGTSYVVPDGTNTSAGTYNYYCKVTNTLNGASVDATSSVVSLTVAQRQVGLTWGNTNLTYNGAEQAPTATATGLVHSDVCTVTVTGGGAAAGNYTATAASLSNANYQLPDNNTKDFTIAKKAVTIKANDQTVELNSAISNTVSDIQATSLIAGHSVSAITITGSGTSAITTSGTITPSAATIIDGDSNDVTANYNITYQTGVLTVTKINSVLQTAPEAISQLTYNGGEQALVTAGTADGGTIYYSIDGTDWSSSVPQVKNAGDYTVRYYVKGDNDHNDLGSTNQPLGTVNVSIAKKAVTVSGILANNKIYNGTTEATANTSMATFAGICTGDTLTVSATAEFADANAGENKVVNLSGLTLGGTDVANYQLAASGNQTQTTASILPRDISAGVIVFEREEIERTGSLITPVVKFVKLGSVELQLNTDFVIDDTSDTSGTDYGTYTLKVNGVGNYTGTASHIWKITKTQPQVDEPIIATITYGQLVEDGVLSGSMKHGSTPVPGTLEWVPDFEDSQILQVGSNETYYQSVIFTPDDTDSYSTLHLDVAIVVNPKALQVKADDKEKISGMPNPTLTYTATGFVNNDTAASELTGELECLADETTAGGQTVAITIGTLAASGNYNILFTEGVLTIKAPNIIVNTMQYSDLTMDGATIYGAISPENYATSAYLDKVGFEYKQSDATSYTTIEKGIAASFSEELTNLTPDTDYEYRAFLILKNSTNRVYGDTIQFHTLKDAVEEATGKITVKVSRDDPDDDTENRVVIVSVEHGNDLVVSKNLGSLTSSGLTCEFEHIPDGHYNVVCRTADRKFVETKLLSVLNGEAVEAEFTVKKGKLATLVDVKTTDTPKVAVDGLYDVLDDEDIENAENGTQDVEVKLAVEKKTDDSTADVTSIKEKLGQKEKIDMLLDISLWKTIRDLDAMGNIINEDERDFGQDNSKVLQIAIPYSNVNLKGLVMFRYHGGVAARLTKLSSRPAGVGSDGSFYVDTAGGYIFLYAQGFSTYAIAYEEEEQQEEEQQEEEQQEEEQQEEEQQEDKQQEDKQQEDNISETTETKTDKESSSSSSSSSGGSSSSSGGSSSNSSVAAQPVLVVPPLDSSVTALTEVEKADEKSKTYILEPIPTADLEEDIVDENNDSKTVATDDGGSDDEFADSNEDTDDDLSAETIHNDCYMHWIILVLAIVGVALSVGLKRKKKARSIIEGADVALMAILAISGNCMWDWVVFVVGGICIAATIYVTKDQTEK